MIPDWLDWAVLTVSFFNTICLLWLGLMVLLVGDRRSSGVWLTGSGLLLGALFFTSHTAIMGRGLESTSFGMDFWWWVSWAPAVVAPLAWYGALLWYAGYPLNRAHPHRAWLVLAGFLTVTIALLLAFANPLPSYQYVAGRVMVLTPGIGGIPLLVLAYILFSLLCYLLPLDLLRRPSAGDPRQKLARRRARPWLAGASLALLLAGGLLAWTALWALTSDPLPTFSDASALLTVKRFDLAVETLVALAVTLLGRAVVGFEVFTGRALPRSGFFRHWRSTVLLAGGFSAAAAFTLTINLRPIYSLMLATALMVLFYALYSWRTFADREAFMARLRPFVASQDLYGRLTGPAQSGSPAAEDPGSPVTQFEALCRKLLEVRQAALLPAGSLAALVGPGITYPPDTLMPAAEHVAALVDDLTAGRQASLPGGYEAVIPLWMHTALTSGSERRLSGLLLLGEKHNRAPLTEEEMEIAQAAGERLLDLLAGSEMARLAFDLLRQRLAQTRVLEGQGRRVLHDEILPELHTAILLLSAQAHLAECGEEGPAGIESHAAVDSLVNIHRRISDLMRALPLATPYQLASGGLDAALRALLEGSFVNAFDRVVWEIDAQAAERARSLPLFAAEVVFFAARELVRNAARHGRGKLTGRELTLYVTLESTAKGVALVIADDGVGYRAPEALRDADENDVSGSGLRIHAALLAAVGASLEIGPRICEGQRPGGGTRAVMFLPTTHS